MYLLLDANVVAGYYLPRSLQSRKARERARIIIDSVRSGATNHFLYIANFCVAEVFSVFAKYAFGTWNRHVKKAGGTIDKRVYLSLRTQFAKDIHNGALFYHYELSRYHVLGIDLVAPIDHYFQISRGKGRNHKPAGTFDHLLISMGIHLAHIHGAENVCLVSTDDRLTSILSRCRNGVSAKTIKRLKLNVAEQVTGKPFSGAIFPRFLNLKSATHTELCSVFGVWPLPIKAHTAAYRWSKA